eukprot:1699602-Amphidinium_carterae.1
MDHEQVSNSRKAKESAWQNMSDPSLTELTSQPLMSRLKDEADSNMLCIFTTMLVFQLPISWLKLAADRNMEL